MRDRETVEIGLSAAETGHLVVSTLHTIDAGQTVNRILGMFEQEEQDQIRLRLSDTLRWVVSQRLAPKIGGGRQALLEIMGSNIRVQDSIVMGESEGKSFYEIIESSQPFGWHTFDQAVLQAYEDGLITEEIALSYCSKRGPVTRGIDNVKKKRGEATTTLAGLKMQHSGRDNLGPSGSSGIQSPGANSPTSKPSGSSSVGPLKLK
jgi:twitching motility protein PilT